MNSVQESVFTYKLHDWIDIDKMYLRISFLNPIDLQIYQRANFRSCMSWMYLSSNPNAIDLLEKYPEIINWSLLSYNPSAINLLEKNPEK